MFRKPYYLMPVALAMCLIGNASAQTVTWTAGGDQTSWTDPNNWSGGVPLSVADIWIDPQLSSLQTVTLGASVAVTASDNVYLEWGQTLNVYGSIASGLFFSPVGGVGGPATTINLHGTGSLSAADTLFVGDPFWVNGITIPDVIVNMYDNSSLTTKFIGMAGHLNIYGGTATITAPADINGFGTGFLTGTSTWGPWGSSPSTGPASIDANRLINIAGGRLVVAGNITAQANDLIARGILEGDGVVGNVNVDITSDPGWTIVTAAPEPSSIALFGLGGFAMLLAFRRRAGTVS